MTRFETRVADWLSYREAVDRVLSYAAPLGVERLAFSDAIGRALAHDLTAPRRLPEHDNSGMDGYAVRSVDITEPGALPVELRVVGESLPGAPWREAVGPGEAVRIMTGAAVPPGADSVVRVEHTSAPGEASVLIERNSDAGSNVRPAGEDMRAGDVVVRSGDTLSPGHVAVLTSTGHIDVPVHAKPRVALLSTGDELLPVAALQEVGDDDEARNALWCDRIVDSNTPMLAACVEEAGATTASVGIAKDDAGALVDALEEVGGADLLVTTGGASMGTHDLLKRVMEGLDFRVDFWRARIRPGSPVSLGFLPRPGRPDLPVFGLPGNPASAFVTFELFVRPYLRALGGHRTVERRTVQARAGSELRGPAHLTAFLRVSLDTEDGELVATGTGPQGSGLVQSLALADGLARLDEGVERALPGDLVPVLQLRAP